MNEGHNGIRSTPSVSSPLAVGRYPIYMLTFALRFRRRRCFQQATYVIEKPTGTAQVYMADGSTRVVQGSDGFRALRANPAVPPSSPNGSILPRYSTISRHTVDVDESISRNQSRVVWSLLLGSLYLYTCSSATYCQRLPHTLARSAAPIVNALPITTAV